MRTNDDVVVDDIDDDDDAAVGVGTAFGLTTSAFVSSVSDFPELPG